MTHKVCLKWNDYQANIVSSYQDLRSNSDFYDVTLVCEEDQQIEAHRVILSTSSPFFSSILKSSKHSNPMIYMRGIRATDLTSIVDFIYNGEVNVCQEDLVGFLTLAEDLQLRGLSASQNEVMDGEEKPKMKVQDHEQGKNSTREKVVGSCQPQVDEISNENKLSPCEDFDIQESMNVPTVHIKEEGPARADTSIENQIDSMMEVETINDGRVKTRCTGCGKEKNGKYAIKNMKQHILGHIESSLYKCMQCGKVIRTSTALKRHISMEHK